MRPLSFVILPKNLDLEDCEEIIVFVKRAVHGCHPLKFVNFATRHHIRTYGIFYIEVALKAGALIKEIKVWLGPTSPDRPYASSGPIPDLSSKYDKKLISHG